MPITTKTVSAPKTSTTAKTSRVPASFQRGKGGSSGKTTANIATTLSKSSRRMHRAAQINEKRPEVLAMLDFKPLYVTNGNLTLAGKMFKARVSERAQTLETISDMLKSLEESLPSEFGAALNQYTSALAATEADITLLKLMILLREYATHVSRFLDFRDEYEPPDELDLSFLGSSTKNQVRNVFDISQGKGNNAFWKYAAVPLLQVLADLPLCSYAIIPSQMSKKKRTANMKVGVAKKFKAYKRENLPVLTIGFVARDMVASYEFVKLRIGDEVDEEFLAIVEEVLDGSFLSSARSQSFSGFRNLIGTDGWTRLRGSSDTERAGLTTISNSKVEDLLRTKKGVIGAMTKKYKRESLLLPEKTSVSYGRTEYQTIDALVDDAFSGDPPLNFEDFNEAIGGLTEKLRNLELFGKTMFRMGNKADDYEGGPRDFAIVADDMPFSVGSAGAVVLDTWNRRFLAVFKSSAYNDFDEWLSQEHMMYNRMIAWFMIRDDYETAYGFISAFINDYEKGFLTAAGMPEEDTDEDSDTYGEMSDTAFVLPGTSTPANISTIGTHLGSRISSSQEWYQSLSKYSPASGTRDDDDLPVTKDGYNLNSYIFGEPTETDLRYVNVMFKIHTGGVDDLNRKSWAGSKIVAAEIIDAVFEIMRGLMSPLGEAEAVADGDPIFPSLTESKSPYGNGFWDFTESVYDVMGTEMWVPTLELWNELFARSSDKTTYFRSASFKNHAKNILRTLSALMESVDFIKLRYGYIDYTCADTSLLEWDCCTMAVKSTDAPYDNSRHQDFFSYADNVIDDILESSWDDIESLSPPSYTPSGESGSSGVTLIKTLHRETKSFMVEAHENDVALEFLYDFIGAYGDRIDNYNTAVQALVEGEDSALGTFVNSVLEAGDAGVDLLQNITPNQLALKQIALEEERGDEDNAYLPTLAILTKSETKAVRVLAQEIKAVSPEGDNVKLIMVGLPAGLFDTLEIEDEFGLRVSYVDIEYPQIVFRGKNYPFFKDMYVSPSDLERSLAGVDDLEDIVKKMRFTELVVEIEESDDTSASIEVEDTARSRRARSSNLEPYANHAASEILKMYCRIMLGLNFSESAFLGTSEGIQIPINDYAADLASAMAAGLETIGELSEDLSGAATDLLSDLSVIEDESFVSGELEAVDEALITSLRDAFQTRLFSAGLMRSRVMSAKLFDRIFALAVDPDEFYIVAPDDTDVSGVSTPQLILDFYLQKGIIEETGLDAPFRYKLAPRQTAEGRMAFGKFFVSITSTPTNPDRTFE